MRKLALLVATGSLVAGCAAAEPDDLVTEEAEQAATTCNTLGGIYPTKAALAVAMATELGRWEATVDLKIDSSTGWVALSDAGKNQCSTTGNSGCPKVTAILNLQDDAVNEVISKDVFNATSFREDLKASFGRQNDAINNQVRQELASYKNYSSCRSTLTCAYVPGYPSPTSDGQTNPAGSKNPSSTCLKTPEQHKLTSPTVQKGAAACGSQYDLYTYKAKKANGSSLCQPDLLKYELYFFGQDTGNPFLQFSTTLDTVTLDPAGDDASQAQNAGSGCPTYNLDRVNDPGEILKGTCCTTQAGAEGRVVDIVRNAGYNACKAIVVVPGTTPTPPPVNEPCNPTVTLTKAENITLGTTSSFCLKVAAPIAGWGASSTDGRTLSINTYPKNWGEALPAQVNGAYYFAISPGACSWTQIQLW